MIEFNKVSNESYFIKNLLYSTFLPLLRTVRANDYIIKDRLYIYKCNIIKCTSSGYIPVKNANLNVYEYPEKLLRKTDDEKVKVGQVYYSVVNGTIKKIIGAKSDYRSPMSEGWFEENIATYKILGEYYFGEMNGKFCRNFLSSSEGYDYKTHERLGQYLRNLRDMYGLNLLPLYNCFSNQLLKNIHINNDSIERTSKDYSTKVYRVPIRFNTDYTICMTNIGMTTFAPAFIHHGTLLKLNNNRFGNNVDATNKYIKLNHEDVIHNEPNLRFKNPIKLRFDNVPKNKVIHYSKLTYTEIPSKYISEYYRLNQDADPAYIKKEVDDAYLSIDYNNPLLEGHKNYRHGYEFVLNEDNPITLTPDGDDAQVTPNGFILPPVPSDPEDPLYADEATIRSWGYQPYIDYFDGVEGGINPYEEVSLFASSYELYESINPSIGTFEEKYKSYKKCPEDETFFNRNIFNHNKRKYYTYDEVENTFVRCTISTVYDPEEVYYYIDKEKNEGWYEFVDDRFVKTTDTYIKPDKVYYKKEMTEVPLTYNYDITEENCCMYDYIEDELYLLIQVPSSFDSNIVILEGDYTVSPKELFYEEHKLELFSDEKLDDLFTKNLILMETGTNSIRPFSPTLIQFLLWNAICNLDSLNNDFDRLYIALDDLGSIDIDPRYNGNYWYNKYREEIFKYSDTFPRKYIRDNLGYVIRDIERILLHGDDFKYSYAEIEATDSYTYYEEDEEI